MATETLRPNAAGDLTQNTPLSGTNWSMVDEVVADDSTSYVYQNPASQTWLSDLYNLPASSGSGTINFIKVYGRGRNSAGSPNQTNQRLDIKSGTTTSTGTAIQLGNWTNFNDTWNTDPDTSAAWTWAAIDALQIGISMREGVSGGGGGLPSCTQVYVEVDYTEAAGLENKSANMAARLMAAGVF